MKKITLGMMAVLCSATLVFANGTEEPTAVSSVAVTRAKGSKQFKLFYKSNRTGNVAVTIANEQGKTVFAETLRQTDGFIRPYNFGELAYGSYTITIEDQAGKQVQSIQHSADRVEKQVHIMKLEEEGKYMLTVASRGTDVIGVRILDANNAVLHDKQYNVKGEFAQVYNLQQIKKFKIEVTDDSGVLKTLEY